MKISLQWLNDYIDIQDYFAKPQDLAALLTAAGIEVEGIENLAKTYDSVVIGHILKKDQHPNADRLSLCQVATGDGVVHQIVCGAQNHKVGDNVVAALPGAVLPGNFVIKLSKIRSVESGGMLCSAKELGLPLDSFGGGDGIIILPKDAPVGQPFAKYMGFDDILFELKVTPNRSDCLSHFGLAREIGAVLAREPKFPIESMMEKGSTRSQVAFELRDSENCPRYAGRGVQGVKVGPSPDWLKKRLESIGMASINNVVDVTNFVMMELGQPMHAFDVRSLSGGKVVVDRAVAGETFTTLDGTDLKLDGTELTIRDGERAVALAGVIGGKNSGIQDDTTDIFLESAYFNPSTVRKTARKFGIETDSSYRFARGTNPEAVPLALNRAAQLVQKVAGGTILGEAYDQYPKPLKREPIAISREVVEDRMGYKVDGAEFVQWMQRLGCTIEQTGENERGAIWKVLPPVFRWDLAVDMDLVEEYARLHGYQHIPESLAPLAAHPAQHDASFVNEAKLRRLLQGAGCLQAINYAFISRTFQARVLGDVERLAVAGLRAVKEPIALINPLNEEINVMRTALLPGLLKNVIYNSRQGNNFGRLFEIGFSHYEDRSADGTRAYAQEGRLAFAFWGQPEDLWQKSEGAPIVLKLKATIENTLRELGHSRWKWTQKAGGKDMPEFVHPGQAARLEVQGKTVGFIGTLHPTLADEFKIREACAVGELNLDRLLVGQPKAPKYQPISKFPIVDRDIAFVMPRELEAAAVESEIRKTGGDLLREVRVFDVFEGGSLQAGQKSVAFRLLFQSKDATLDDKLINELRDKVVNAVSQKLGVSIRA
jgi:phenylalanyl-tRNA synthetase beta chain